MAMAVFALLMLARRDGGSVSARSSPHRRDASGLRAAVRVSFADPSRDGGTVDSAEYLDRFVLSFGKDGGGSEYHRLVVDAHAPLLVDRILPLLADPELPSELRIQLIEILGTERFAGDPRVNSTLVGLLVPETPLDIAQSVLQALAQVGDASAVDPLERYAAVVPWSSLPYEIYDTIAELAGSQRNSVLRRIFPGARDDVSRTLILDRIDRSDPEGALSIFSEAWNADAPVRAAAALRLGNYRTDGFKRFVEDKLAVETDAVVRKNLERAREMQGKIPDYDAMQAAGPPDADPQVDHPKAWASERENMGIQWVELTYRSPLRASRLRIFEVNSAGAVVEVQTTDEHGQRRSIWQGSDPTARPGVFELKIPTTAYRVRKVRVILDTSRRPGWNEIDAVEVVGPEGRAWASSAVASSSYGAD
jgi:hypothetical protein